MVAALAAHAGVGEGHDGAGFGAGEGLEPGGARGGETDGLAGDVVHAGFLILGGGTEQTLGAQ